MTILHALLAIASGSLVGFTLGLVGGGGSILAVPLLVYVVGVRSPHIAIGTSAIAVAASAAANLAGHARAHTVKWPCALVFAVAGIAGAAGGALSGFFGIGGGFLIVPGLMGATAMPLINAIGSSLVSVTAFGLTTAASYAWSGLVDWQLAGLFIVGGALGGLFGTRLARHLAGYKHALTRTFSGIVIAVGLYVIARSILA